VAAAAAALLVACSGGGEGDQAPRVTYGKLVTFGDSLSDVGTYNVGVVAQLGGGRYSVNTGDAINWTELLAATLGLDPLCPAETGLNSAAELGGPVPVVEHAGCYSYAQGGARVTDPIGPGNAALLAAGDPSGALGQLTKPVTLQIDAHLAAVESHSFASDDLVTVLAGANDLFMNLAIFQATVAGGGSVDAAKTIFVDSMEAAATQLSGYVKDKIVAKGATHVVVVNMPDVAITPEFLAQTSDTQALIEEMVQAFNAALAAGLSGTESNVLQVDLYSTSKDQAANPTQYGLTNVTNPACDLTVALKDLPSSLVCTTSTLVPDATETWAFADTVHPTPYGYQLIAQLVNIEMAKKGWL
jgi:phospholipase/lecithinase/hemolysin